MKRIIALAVLILSTSIYAQDTFNDGFCNALKQLSKNVKKGKIKRVSYNDTTYQYAGRLLGIEKSVATDYMFSDGQYVFQSNYGNPMGGQNDYVDEFQVLIAAFYLQLENVEVQNAIVKLLKDAKTTISNCGCKKLKGDTIPEIIKKDSYNRIEWDCNKKGKVSLVYSAFEISTGVADFKSYINFNYLD